MSKRDKLYISITSSEGIVWPATPKEAQEQAVELFGATVMGAMDTVVKNRLTGDIEKDKLVKEACASTIYWLFCKLDQFPGANINMVVEGLEDKEGNYRNIGVINEEELRLLFFEWLEKYSDTVNADEITSC